MTAFRLPKEFRGFNTKEVLYKLVSCGLSTRTVADYFGLAAITSVSVHIRPFMHAEKSYGLAPGGAVAFTLDHVFSEDELHRLGIDSQTLLARIASTRNAEHAPRNVTRITYSEEVQTFQRGGVTVTCYPVEFCAFSNSRSESDGDGKALTNIVDYNKLIGETYENIQACKYGEPPDIPPKLLQDIGNSECHVIIGKAADGQALYCSAPTYTGNTKHMCAYHGRYMTYKVYRSRKSSMDIRRRF